MSEKRCLLPILISKVNKLFTKECETYLKPKGLSKIHAYYLFCLYNNIDGLKLKDINDFVGCDKANTSRAIKDLLVKGIIDKSADNDNEKKYNVMLTTLGKQLCNEIVPRIREKIRIMCNVFDEDEYEMFIGFLKRLQ